VIKSIKDKTTRKIWERESPKGFPKDILRIAYRKLSIIHAATSLQDLRSPPGNHLEKLAGDRVGQHSININDQWRICFIWDETDAYEVEVNDYH
jgi:proteic killer suppression protein